MSFKIKKSFNDSIDELREFFLKGATNFFALYLTEECTSSKLFGELKIRPKNQIYLANLLMQLGDRALGPNVYYFSIEDYRQYWCKNIKQSDAAEIFERYVDSELDVWRRLSDKEISDWGFMDVFNIYAVLSCNSILNSETPQFDIRRRRESGQIREADMAYLKKNLNEKGWSVFLHYVFCAMMMRKFKQKKDGEKPEFPNLKAKKVGRIRQFFAGVWRAIKNLSPSHRDWS